MKQSHKILLLVSILLAGLSWIVAIKSWALLPSVIPVHFGVSGQADAWANKSVFNVFLIPALQTLILGILTFVYYKPQYSDIPTTMWLTVLDKKQRDHAFSLIRSMLVGVMVWIGLFMSYITYGMNVAALDKNSQSLSVISMSVLVIGLVGWITFWTIKVYRATNKAIKLAKKN